jgi:opacity protein-like surface antigen
MPARLTRTSVALLSLLITTPTLAADWGMSGSGVSYDHGIKDYEGGEAVPVPAPVPIPEYEAKYYFRLDIAVGIVNEPDLSGTTGILPDMPGPVTGPEGGFTIPSSWFSSDFDTLLTAGAGVGAYLGRGWRIDATIEKRSKDDFGFSGQEQYDTHDIDGLGNYVIVDTAAANGIADTQTRVTMDDRSSIDGTVWMANVYYDLAARRGFTPYIGAGIGFVWNEIERSNSTTIEQCNDDGVAGSDCDVGNYSPHPDHPTTITSSDKANKVSLAAAAMAGVSYQISDITSFDVGYRYLYMQGASAVLDVGGIDTRVEVGDQHVHQLRAGLRFDVQ